MSFVILVPRSKTTRGNFLSAVRNVLDYELFSSSGMAQTYL